MYPISQHNPFITIILQYLVYHGFCVNFFLCFLIFCIHFELQDANPALRLKDEVIAATLLSASGPSGQTGGSIGLTGSGASANDITESGGDIEWQYFDERSYIDAKKVQDGEDAYSRNKFNQAASDKLASNRVIPDTRSTQCKARKWPHEDLPETSVIITFHNEARSTLLRTIVR